MKSSNVIFLISLLTAGLLSCHPDAHIPDPVNPAGTPTEVGTPLEAAFSKVIGTQGGTLATADGRAELIIPAGALTRETTISIQPVSNNTPNGVGVAYRFMPDGLVFSKPATLKFRYANSGPAGSVPEALGVAYQRTDRIWYNVPGKSLDKQKQEVTVPMPHFSDWSLFEQFHLTVGKPVLNYGESTTLEIVELAPLSTTTEAALVQKTSGANGGLKWALAGGGTLKPSGASARYTAPAKFTQTNPVTVSVEVTFENNPAKVILVKEIYIGTGFIKLSFLGKEYAFSTCFMNDEEPAFSTIAGGTSAEVFSLDFMNGKKGTFKFGYDDRPGFCRVNFELSNGKQYDSGHDNCNGKDMIANGQVVFEEYVPGKYAKGSISGNLINYDDACTTSGPAISGTFYVNSAGLSGL